VKRILLLTEVFPPKVGGSGRWLWELYRRLPREAVHIAAGEDPRQVAFDQSHDLHVERLPLVFPTWGLLSCRGLWHYWRTLRQLRSILQEKRIGVLHCGKALPEGLLAYLLRRKTGLPYFCYVHGEELNIAQGSRELRWWTRRVLSSAQRVIANSHNTAQLLREEWQVPSDRLNVLHPGVNTGYFQPAPHDDRVRADLGWKDRLVILTVGRLQKRKGQDMLLRALVRLIPRFPNLLYSIIGEGEERSTLEKLTKELGLVAYVQFLGEIPHDALLRCYQQCDVFALPNRTVDQDFEGFGMVLVEAQACGKAVIAGASGGTAETMHVPDTGRVVPCETPEPLANTLAELLADNELRRRMGQAARRWVEAKFDWEPLALQAGMLFDISRQDVALKPASEPVLI
jgi:phosphatidyl-myo-inositol dimannoside synthase